MSGNNQPSPEDRLAQSRMHILRAASSVFLDAGFERASVDRIAAVARMSKQSIYDLFPRKQDLFEAAVRCELDAGRSNLATIQPSGSPEEALAQFGQRLFEGFVNPANFGLFRLNIVAATHFPELADELHEHRLALSRKLADYLETLIQDDVLEKIDPLSGAIRFGGLVVEGSRYFLGAPLPQPADRQLILDTAINLFLHGYAQHIDPDGAVDDTFLCTVAPPVVNSGVALRLSADKLQGLIDAALAEFLEQGYPGANIDRIAAAARTSKATIYRQFGNKEGLFRHVIEREIFTSSGFQFPIDPQGSVEAALVRLARQILDWHLTSSNIHMHRLLVKEAHLLPDLAQRFHDMRAAVAARALNAVLAMHHLPQSTARTARAFYLLATFAVRFLTVQQFPDPAQRDRYSREAALLFLHGLTAKRTVRRSTI